MGGIFMKVVFLFLFNFSAYGQSVIDLGNLEIEGEVRRPMIKLFQNPQQINNSYKEFAQDKITQTQAALSELSQTKIDNKKAMLDIFEKKALEFK